MTEEPKSCPRCGAPLGREVGGHGVCTACLLEDALPTAEGLAGSAESPDPDADAPVVQRLGDYELLEEIGRGGMGVIYKARQAGLDRVVALKLLLAGEFAEPRVRRRLVREARLAARLSHPGIVTIHEVGEQEGRPFFAMEYVPGPNLAQRCRDGLLPVATAVRYVEQLARAVHYAHQQGVIHCDLKPANVLLTPEDHPKLTDFGLTRSLLDPTGTLESAGSPNFMAPEQADARLGPPGVATDVFGLGAVLYYLLTGQPPAVGASLSETLRAVLADAPVPPRHIRPALPVDLETITLHCLAKEPGRRYASALAVAEELARWRQHLPIVARPASRLELLLRRARRNPLSAALGAGLVTAVVLGIQGVAWQWRRAEAEKVRATLSTPWEGLAPPSEVQGAAVEVGDVNGDGRPDLLVATVEDGGLAVYLNRGQGTFAAAPGSPWLVPHPRRGQDLDGALAVGDFDGDGHLDVALADQTTDTIRVLRGDGQGRFGSVGEAVAVGREPRGLRAGRVNADPYPDLVVANWGGNTLTLLLGDGTGRFHEAAASPLATDAAPWGLALADFNADRLDDLAVAHSGASTVAVWLNNGAGKFTPAPASPWRVGKDSASPGESCPFDLTTADLNRDDLPDLISADTRTHSVTVLLGDGRGGFRRTPQSLAMVGSAFPRRVLAGDVTGDGLLDLVTANESGNLSVLRGDGRGGLVPLPNSPLFEPGPVHGLAVADLDGDGRLDVVAGSPFFGVTLTRNAVLTRRAR